MTIDRARLARVESLRRAGLEYVAAARLSEPTVDSSTPNAGESPPNSPVELLATLSAIAPEPRDHDVAKSKKKALAILAEEVAACTRCCELAPLRTQTVFSDGTPNAELCFVGEAPGADEDEQGVPFVGKAGQLLTKIIEACKLRRDEVYICNVIKCRPPDNRNPNPDEVANCKPFLERQLEIVRPKIMVALGKYAAAHLLGERPENVPVMRLRGQVREYLGIPFMITLHPAYVLRNPNSKREVWEDMKEVMRRLGRPVD